MTIHIDNSRKLFRIDTADMTYAFAAAPDGRLCHLYWGGRLQGAADLDDLYEDILTETACGGVGQTIGWRQEYAVSEAFDELAIALFPLFADGSRGIRLRYIGYELQESVLSIILKDSLHPDLSIYLNYRTWNELDLISRSITVETSGTDPVILERAFSASVELPCGQYRMTHLAGHWGAEYTKYQRMLGQEMVVLESRNGNCAAHQHVPFLALDTDGAATEEHGEVFFGVLQWSGEMKMTAESDFYHHVRINAGLSDEDTRITITGDQPFESPAFVIGYSQNGFSGMSRTLYDWQYDFLCPQTKVRKPFPIIYNSWYPYEFGVTEENCIAMVQKAADVGAELFVIDDGWMQGRINDQTGLGDWIPDQTRFPNGLRSVSEVCHKAGLLFGLWVEPEMLNPDSELYRAHPDWVLQEDGRAITTMRNQYVLDLSNKEVLSFCFDFLEKLLKEEQLDYLKWDMNRYISEYSRNRELKAAYIQNLYRIWQFMNEKFPQVFFENCASGGGRADFGMLPYADRINRSDNADPVDVMRIHESFTMLFLPKLAGGAGNIAPQHSVNDRELPFSFRAMMGMTGSMSIGINLLRCSPEELDAIRSATALFKKYRHDLMDCYVLRLKSVYDGPVEALEYLRRDGETAIVFVFGHGLRLNEGNFQLRLRGLKPACLYTDLTGKTRSGSYWM